MIPNPDNDAQLERLIHRTLRDVPLRRAPDSLARRVLAEIERRAALPWWRKSFAHWPLLARGGFVVVSAALVRFALTLGMWVMAGFDSAEFKEVFSWLDSARAVVTAITNCVEIVSRNIPSLWLYGGLIFFAAMYATLFGLGAAAYKALRAHS